MFVRFWHLWNYQFIVVSVLIVTVCRSQEMFRLSKSSDDVKDYTTAESGFKHIDQVLIRRLLKVDDIPWPNQNSHMGYTDRKPQYERYMNDYGVFMHLCYAKSQLSFLWVHNSGLLLILIFAVQGLLLDLVLKSTDHKFWKVIYGFVCFMNTSYLAIQCLPGFLVRLDIGLQILESHDMKELPDLILQYSWFKNMFQFIIVLLSEGTPAYDTRIYSWNVNVRGLEGIEVALHASISLLARAVTRGCLLCLAFCLKITALNKILSSIWRRCWPSLANFSANLAVRDIMNTKRAILGAEIALNTRKSCNCQNMKCIAEKDLEELASGMGMGSNRVNETAEKRGRVVGLFKCVEEAMKEAKIKGVNEERIVRGLGPALALMNQFYVGAYGQKYDSSVATAAMDDIRKFCDDSWNAYQAKQVRCVREADWCVINASLCAAARIRASLQRSG